jgi:hypothetical protein
MSRPLSTLYNGLERKVFQNCLSAAPFRCEREDVLGTDLIEAYGQIQAHFSACAFKTD